jgi:hypothetical protein
MPREEAALPGGVRLADLMSVTMLASVYPPAAVHKVLEATGRHSLRERSLPATLMVYYVMALAIYMQVSYEEILRVVVDAFNWFAKRGHVDIPAKSSISEARSRLGSEPLQLLAEQMVHPVATKGTRGAYYRDWRLVSLDGSTLDVGDTAENEAKFGRPGVSRGPGSAYPQIRFCSLLESGTHILFGAKVGAYNVGETTLAHDVVQSLRPGMLCLADRSFFSYDMWRRAATEFGADLLWRVKKNLVLAVEDRLPDGSYLSTIYASATDRRNENEPIRVRVVEYRLQGAEQSDDTLYRLITSVLDAGLAPAMELAALYTERWEIEITLDEFKTHLRGRNIVMRSKTPEGVLQEFWGFVLAHNAIRTIMHDAAVRADQDPDRLSFVHALRTVQRRLPFFIVVPPSGQEATI